MEHEVSLNSAAGVLKHLDQNKYDVTDIFVSKTGTWSFDDHKDINDTDAIEILKQTCDVVFLAVHGTYGEDGQLQAKLEQAGITYTGSDPKASALAMNKQDAQKVFAEHDLRVPATQVLSNASDSVELELPVVVKPVSQGSSVGVSIVKQASQLDTAIKEAFSHDDHVMVQEFISGREVSCGVLENPDSDALQALLPTELIIKNAEFFDYKSKYTAGETDEVTPPDMPEELIQAIQTIAKKAHKILGCRGYSRTDMIIRGNSLQEIFVIETNTLPGMTPTSLLPQQAAAVGISFSELLDRIIENTQK